MKQIAAPSSVEEAARQVVALRRIPRATYRLQLNRNFRFGDVEALLPYLDELGISDVYVSPISQACFGSSHGYDICNHNRINPELGTEADLQRLFAELAKRYMGLVLDVVPNHMGIRDACNTWWMDVLENGPSSNYARYFDIDWKPAKRELRNKVLLPILEDQYGKTLESGKLLLVFENGSFFVRYHESVLPVAPRTYSDILGYRLDVLSTTLGSQHPHFQELQSILTALSYLPPRTELDPGKLAERCREKEVVKRRTAALYKASPEIQAAIDAAVQEFNGVVDNPHSFDNLDALLGKQAYRLAFWKVAAEEINYRRFFDINDLAAIRTEDPDVFCAAHELLLRLLITGQVTGLRIDHADGLWDPAGYLRQLQYVFLLHATESRLAGAAGHDMDGELSRWFETELESGAAAQAVWPLYAVAEKILSEDEPLPRSWAVYGTTGYDFLKLVNGLFVDGSQEHAITQVYTDFTSMRTSYRSLVHSSKKMIMLVSLASEIYSLSHKLDEISEKNRRYRDFTLDSFTFGIREVIASLGIYRTYITAPDTISQRDRRYIEAAVADAKKRNPRTAEALFDFIQDTLLLHNLRDFRKGDRTAIIDWVLKFQQISGPVMAKGVEDTAFYVFNRLVSLNEVGGNPGDFGTSLDAFHRKNLERQKHWPHSMSASSTHDTKRSEDVRARINAISEMPSEWAQALARWREMNAPKKATVDGESAPDSNDEYLFYQTLLGVWPPATEDLPDSLCERVSAYMQKTIKEAKVHTSWVNPNVNYDKAVNDFVMSVLGDQAFLQAFLPFQQRIEHFGNINALAQLLLKLTCPGVPDFYQGSEIWDLRLVDPDNRGPIDYQLRSGLLTGLVEEIAERGEELHDFASELMTASDDGRIKLYVIHRTLSFRKKHPEIFRDGDYVPCKVTGPKASHACAFTRLHGTNRLVVAVPRLVGGLLGGTARYPVGEGVWMDTWLELPGDQIGKKYQNLFTGEEHSVGLRAGVAGISLESVFSCFPVVLLQAST